MLMTDEDQDDHAVDALITGMQGMLDRLKSDSPEPKNLKEAGDKAYGLMKASRLKTPVKGA
jgi:hypothetical protein